MVSRCFEEVIRRIRAEYVEMPGMILVADQVERLCGVEPALCRMALDTLVQTRFLRQRADGAYVRVSSGEPRGAP